MYLTQCIEELVRIETMLQSQLSLNNPNIQPQVRLYASVWLHDHVVASQEKLAKQAKDEVGLIGETEPKNGNQIECYCPPTCALCSTIEHKSALCDF